MKKILINFAHPARQKSTVNRGLINAASELNSVTVNDLYRHYPDFAIDVKREQHLCETHDIIVFQHPFYWYSTPAIVKEWMDLVLEHGWAYGKQGNALKDKYTFQAISTGADESTYYEDGANGFTLDSLTSPFHATVTLCKMKKLPPFLVNGVHRGMAKDKLAEHTKCYQNLLAKLSDDSTDIDAAISSGLLNNIQPTTGGG